MAKHSNLSYKFLGQPADYSLNQNFKSMIKDGQIDSKKRDIQYFDAHEFDGQVRSKQDMIVYLDEHSKFYHLFSLTPL